MAQKTNRVILEGSTWGGEVWSTSFAFADTTIPVDGGVITDYGDLATLASAIFADWGTETWATALLNALASSNTLDRVRVEARDGTTLIQAAESDGTPINGNGGNPNPPQTAFVISLRTGRPGRSYKGRMYFPLTGMSVASNTGRLNPVSIGPLLTGAKDMIKATLAQADTVAGPGSDFKTVVYSSKLDLVTPVTTIAIGDVVDSQRRRRDRLSETYYVTGLA